MMKPLHHLSASQLKTLSLCPRKWYFYHEGMKAEETDTTYLKCGSKVHESIESHLNGNEMPDLSDDVNDVAKKHYFRCLDIYHELNIPEGGDVEKELKAIVNGVEIGGRMDYIAGNRIYDWKTGKPRSDDYIQAAVYQRLARENGISDPKVIFVHLSSGTMRTMPDYPHDSVDALVQSALDIISTKAFMPRYGSHCRYCPYVRLCEEAEE